MDTYNWPHRFESRYSSGGQFAAHEKPEELADDLFKMFERSGPAFSVAGRTGYDTSN